MQRHTTAILTSAAAAMLAAAAIAPLAASAGGSHRAAPPRAAGGTTVRIGDYYFRSKRITIAAGTSVRFVNAGKIEHTVADSSRSGTVRSRVIRPRPLAHGASQTVRFPHPGTVYYLCTLHPTLMKGVVVVR